MADERWIAVVRARGWQDLLLTALDMLEPLGPLGAQMLWIAQPALGAAWGEVADGLARALDEPGGIDRLRQRLAEDDV